MDQTFIAMDYYPLGDLTRQIVTSGPFDETIARDIAEQILHAVFVLHKHNLVHRDIKPQVCLNLSRPILILCPPYALSPG